MNRIHCVFAPFCYTKCMPRNDISPEELRTLIDYNPSTGEMTWRKRPESMFARRRIWLSWNTRYAGKPALANVSSAGYLRGRVDDRPILAHRAAWAIIHGENPKGDIDHVNGNPLDNRIDNLRHVSRGQNMANSRSARGSSSKYLGVYRDNSRQKWCAEITSGYKKRHLGRFETEREAAEAYDMAAQEAHGEFANLNFGTKTRG